MLVRCGNCMNASCAISMVKRCPVTIPILLAHILPICLCRGVFSQCFSTSFCTILVLGVLLDDVFIHAWNSYFWFAHNRIIWGENIDYTVIFHWWLQNNDKKIVSKYDGQCLHHLYNFGKVPLYSYKMWGISPTHWRFHYFSFCRAEFEPVWSCLF